MIQASRALRLLKVVRGSWAAAEGAGVLLISKSGESIDFRIDTGGSIDAIEVSPDQRYVVASANGELIVIDLDRKAITTLAIGSPVQQLRFLDPELLAFSEPAALKTVRIDRLEYVVFEPTKGSPNRVSF
jgi:hypothetical protein